MREISTVTQQAKLCRPVAQYFNEWTTKVIHRATILTRKLSYHKDDRAMPPIYGCLEKFWGVLDSMATYQVIPKFLMDLGPKLLF